MGFQSLSKVSFWRKTTCAPRVSPSRSLVTSYTKTKPASWVLWPHRCKVCHRIDRGDQIARCWGSTTGRYCWFRMALWSRCRQSPQWVVCCRRSRKRHFPSESRSSGIFDRKLSGRSIGLAPVALGTEVCLILSPMLMILCWEDCCSRLPAVSLRQHE